MTTNTFYYGLRQSHYTFLSSAMCRTSTLVKPTASVNFNQCMLVTKRPNSASKCSEIMLHHQTLQVTMYEKQQATTQITSIHNFNNASVYQITKLNVELTICLVSQ